MPVETLKTLEPDRRAIGFLDMDDPSEGELRQEPFSVQFVAEIVTGHETMESTLIRYFREVYRSGSIREASMNLHVAPSAVSRQIMKLEDQLGVPLFERRPRGMVATEAGDILARFASDLEADVQRISSEIADLNRLHRGQVRILSTEGVVAHFLTPLIAQFSEAWPGVRILHTIAGSEKVVEGVGEGDADIGIAFDMEPSVQVEIVDQIHDPLLMVVAPGHPLASSPQTTIGEIIGYPMALPERGFAIRRLVDGELKRSRLVAKPSVETNSIEALRVLAVSGKFVTFLPALPIANDLANKTLVGMRLSALGPMRATHDVCVMRDRRLPKAVLVFLEALAREVAKVPQRLA